MTKIEESEVSGLGKQELSDYVDSVNIEKLPDEAKGLLRVLRHQQSVIKRLEADVKELKDELDTTKARLRVEATEINSPDDTHLDKRDQTVIEVLLEQGQETVSLDMISSIYKQHTDIRQEETLHERRKRLLSRGPFEKIKNKRRWEFELVNQSDATVAEGV